MILIADSGATKTDWWLGEHPDSCREIRTEGINPFHQSEEQIGAIIENQLLPPLKEGRGEGVSSIRFYGAGCTPEKSPALHRVLSRLFPAADVTVDSDLLGAARALCKHSPGIACILGTGSNSCLYDGRKITANVSPLGYLLGDEGSGAYLGKRFTGDCLKGMLPPSLREGLLEYLGMSVPEIIDRVYRQPQANRFLAGITPYIYENKDREEVKAFLADCFCQFFLRNVLPYRQVMSGQAGDDSLPSVSFVGSVAWFFRTEIEAAARSFGLTIGTFVQAPLHELANYHLLSDD